MTEYPIVKFKDELKQVFTGYRVGKWLAVVQYGLGYKVYRIDVGKPIIDSLFVSKADSIKFAEWLNTTFGEYFDIWLTYPEIDVFSLVKWTVTDGITLYETLQELDKNHLKINHLKEVNEAFYKAKEHESEWYGRLRRN